MMWKLKLRREEDRQLTPPVKTFVKWGVGPVALVLLFIGASNAANISAESVGHQPRYSEQNEPFAYLAFGALINLWIQYRVLRWRTRKQRIYGANQLKNCPKCKYSTKGLYFPGRCPECGLEFFVSANLKQKPAAQE